LGVTHRWILDTIRNFFNYNTHIVLLFSDLNLMPTELSHQRNFLHSGRSGFDFREKQNFSIAFTSRPTLQHSVPVEAEILSPEVNLPER
jgi:hypothetical protein